MGWANCGTDARGRKIGYAIRAVCDAKDCKERIDRGLSFVCGGMHGDGNCLGGCDGYCGCGGYFCDKHLYVSRDHAQLCAACLTAVDTVTTPA